MCGIIGFSGQEDFDLDKIKILMLWNSLERGKDSTGIYSEKNGLIKNTDEAHKFLQKIELQPDKTLLAHVRAATVGHKSDNNAHPFNRNNTVLIHNGTLKNHWGLCSKYNLTFNDYWVDSDVICSIIDTTNSFKVFSEILGAGAFIVTKKDDPDTIYVFRNEERPLYKGNINGNMYISSIKESLEFIGCNNVKEFKDNVLYEINSGIIKNTRVIKKEPYNVTTFYNHNNNNTTNYTNTGTRNWPRFVNKWFKCNNNLQYSYGKSCNFIKGNYYLLLKKVESSFSQYMCEFIDEDGNRIEASIFDFDATTSYEILENVHYILTSNIVASCDDSELAKKGELCLVKSISKDNKVSVTFPNGRIGIWILPSSTYLRQCEYSELDKLLPNISNENNSCNLPDIVTNNEEDFDIQDTSNNNEEESVNDLVCIDVDDWNDLVYQFNNIISDTKATFNITEINRNLEKLEEIMSEFTESVYENY